jgi:hypothetical protein
MKSFSNASFLAALALAPSAFANYLTEKSYSDSACTYLTALTTYSQDGDDCVETLCTVNDDDDDGTSWAETCGSTLLGEIGDNAYSEISFNGDCSNPTIVIPMACAWCTCNELYPCGSFYSALAFFL